MDFHRQIVTCLFSMLRLSFETQKVKENYAIFLKKDEAFSSKDREFCTKSPGVLPRKSRSFARKAQEF